MMDALTFANEAHRMCESYNRCDDCPAKAVLWGCDINNEHFPELVPIVEKWSAEHPEGAEE